MLNTTLEPATAQDWSLTLSPKRFYLAVGYDAQVQLSILSLAQTELVITLKMDGLPPGVDASFGGHTMFSLAPGSLGDFPITFEAREYASNGVYEVRLLAQDNYGKMQSKSLEIIVVSEVKVVIKTNPPVSGLRISIDGTDLYTDSNGELGLSLNVGSHDFEFKDNARSFEAWNFTSMCDPTGSVHIGSEWYISKITEQVKAPTQVVLKTKEPTIMRIDTITAVILAVVIIVALVIWMRKKTLVPVAVVESAKVFCVQCGAENPSDNEFCGKCGQRLGKDTGTAKTP